MPLYDYKCSSCEKVFEKHLPMSQSTPFGEKNETLECPHCGKKGAFRMISGNVSGGSPAEPWEYEEVHKCNGGRGPNYVRDSKGNRHKFNPSVHRKGRKGSG